MLLFATRYVKSLGVLLVAMILYALVVVPMVEPSQQVAAGQTALEQTLPSDHWWEAFFPADSWHAQAPKIISTSNGILLAHEVEEIDGKQMRFHPITMIIPQTDAGRQAMERRELGTVTAQDMWIVSAEDGAIVHFEEPLKNFSDSIPKIERVQMKGEIEVSKQAAIEAGEVPWRLWTRDLSIDKTQLTTRNEVLIEWGASVIQGRDLLIRLRSDILGNAGSSSSVWGPLDELELYQVQKVDVVLPPGGLWADLDPKQLTTEVPALAQLPARLPAKCGGRFSFDFKSSSATLQNGVLVQHLLGNLPPDEFTCERLSISMEPPEDTPAPNEEDPHYDLRLGEVLVTRLEAVGTDPLKDFVAEKQVVLEAPTIGMSSQSKRLIVDLKKGEVEFYGHLDAPEATHSTVVLNYQGIRFLAPQISYRAAPREEGEGKHLGWLAATGSGELTTLSSSPLATEHSLGETTIRWKDSLRMSPSPDNDDSQLIVVKGQTLVDNAEQGYLTSEHLEVWLEQADPQDGGQSMEDNSLAGNYRPKRVFSPVATEVHTKELHCKVAQLDLAINYLADPLQSTTDGNSDAASNEEELSLSDSAGPKDPQWIGPPQNPAPSTQEELPPPILSANQGSRTAKQEKPPQPIDISGNVLRATMVRRGATSWIDNLHLAGPVRVSQTPKHAVAGDPKNLPWEILGTTLQLATTPTAADSSSSSVDLLISGAPAEMKIADGVLKGKAIRYNQVHGVILMEHPGEFVLPKSLLASHQKDPTTPREPGSFELNKVEWLIPPSCKWQGRMWFDGSTVWIEKNVTFRAAMRNAPDDIWPMRGRAEQMQIQMLQPIDLKNLEGEPPKLEIGEVVLHGAVEIVASPVDDLGQQKSRERLVVPKLTYSLPKQQLIASGPGWIDSRFLSDQKLGQLAVATEKAPELQGAYLNFRDSLVAALDRNEVTLEGSVELLFGKLESWEDSMVPAPSGHFLGPEDMLLNCDLLKVYGTSQLSSTQPLTGSLTTTQSAKDSWEFTASGNVAFNGNSSQGSYQGDGSRLTYSKMKSLLSLYSDGREPAHIRVIPNGSRRDTFAGEANVKRFTIDPENFSSFDMDLHSSGMQMRGGLSNQGYAPGPDNTLAPSNAPNPRKDFFNR